MNADIITDLSRPHGTIEGFQDGCNTAHCPAARSTASVRALVKHFAIEAGIEPMQRCQVEVIWCVKDKRRRDADNAAPFAKAIFDGLAADKGVSAHIVADDDPAHMVKLMPRIEYRPDTTPHFEVIVTDLTHRSDAVDQLTKERLT